MSKLAVTAIAPRIAAAKPTTAAGVATVVRDLLPLLPFIFTMLLAADKTGKVKAKVRAVRAALDAMELD